MSNYPILPAKFYDLIAEKEAEIGRPLTKQELREAKRHARVFIRAWQRSGKPIPEDRK